MNIRKLCLITLLLVPFGSSVSALAEEIILNDGSRIKGEVLSMQNGAYQVRTPSLGVISVPKGNVRSISSGGGSTSPAPQNPMNSSSNSMLESLQNRMANDQGIMSSIMQLQHDPDMQAILSDPEVMQAVHNMDLKTLSNHPKIKKLMQNSTVRDIQGKVN